MKFRQNVFANSRGENAIRQSRQITKKKGVLVFGNPIVDIIVQVSAEWLKKHNLQKGVTNFLNQKKIQEILDDDYFKKLDKKYCPGGSVANSAQNISSLGYDVSFVGHVGDDQLGQIFSQSMKNNRVNCDHMITSYGHATTQCYIFVTSDGDRTIVPKYDASTCISVIDVNVDLIKQHVGVFLDSYILYVKEGASLCRMAFLTAKKYGVQTYFTLADPSCVRDHRDTMLQLLPNIDILVGNMREFELLFQETNTKTLVHKLQFICQQHDHNNRSTSITGSHVSANISNDEQTAFNEYSGHKIFVMTLDKYGSLFVSAKRCIFVKIDPFLPNAKVVDTTGAGDAFIAGFLFGYLTGRNIEKCLHIATLMGSTAVQRFGGLIDHRLISRIKSTSNKKLTIK